MKKRFAPWPRFTRNAVITRAVAALKNDLKSNPTDLPAASRLIEILASRPAAQPGGPRSPISNEAQATAAEIAATDQHGSRSLAVAIGFHKARKFELAMPYAQVAAARLNTPAAHLNLGDVLLTLAENQSDPKQQRSSLERAVTEYDLVLKAQPNSVEAINNKAWILHSYLDQSRQRSNWCWRCRNASTRPHCPESSTTPWARSRSPIGKIRDAEAAYADGLKKRLSIPCSTFHLGKMIAGDRSRATKALSHLKRTDGKLSPPMSQEATRLFNSSTTPEAFANTGVDRSTQETHHDLTRGGAV